MSLLAPLDRKLLRDLWRIRGQAVAIGAVVGLGVLMLVMMTGLVNTLEQTRQAYYERYRLADVFAPVARAPDRVLARLEALPGVAVVEGRVTGMALIDLEDEIIPVRAQAVSLPSHGIARLNDIFLTSGRMPDPDRAEEVLLLKGFAEARGLSPGDRLSATMHGSRRSFVITGLAQCPEFLYTTAPGELVPDDTRFAVIWMSRDALGAAYDMRGAFNEALIGLERGAQLEPVLEAVDRVLDPQGGLGAYGLRDQVSNFFIEEEISGLRKNTVAVPPLFLGVSAFLLYIVISRIVQAEREQIGLLKAFGYSGAEVSGHYLKMILVIAIGGAVVGSLGGIAAGRALSGVYQAYYKFPFLVFQLDPRSFVLGLMISVMAASAGAFGVLRGVFRLTPAVAMRPPAPADYTGTGGSNGWARRLLDQPGRMVLRRIRRQPGRMAGAALGIAAGMGLSVGMIGVFTGFNQTIDLAFGVVDRSDAQVSFVEAKSDKVIYELARLPGVLEVEPIRYVSVQLRNGTLSHRGAINGLTAAPRLNRALDAEQRALPLPDDGIVLSSTLARVLDAEVGDTITVDVREGRRPVLQIPVAAVADSLLGSPTYMQIDALNRALREPGRVSGAFLRLDSDSEESVFEAVKDMPSVAGISLKSDMRQAIQKVMDEGAGMMRFIMLAIAGIVTFGIVFNAARIAYAERARDLASLRVIGFSRGETAFVLLGELAAVTLAALPLGALFGYGMSAAVSAAFSTEVYSIPLMFDARTVGTATLAVLFAAVMSGWIVKRDLDRLPLVEALKTRE
ncbi:putative ABC transport system permease protein [Aliiruegeria haliotis]|uniref:Putative ABC transport system permease protein n=1 Tax=Aliiruegeria haliotis TaxID=1280846 RepID=A0A2T0RVS6_9RHOB|nr:FtsX-like permease family protein [Aliiruegeria haliotis]PRY25299.1 putative ABC transport system permease protein [Aliiruegeria haliotis]